MAKHVWKIPINDETSEEDLHRCIIEAGRTSDPNVMRAASNAAAELARRERKEWRVRLEFESKERINAQKFQQDQMDKQLRVAGEQATAARRAMWAAWAAAIATISIAVFSAISLVGMHKSPSSENPPASVEESAVPTLPSQ